MKPLLTFIVVLSMPFRFSAVEPDDPFAPFLPKDAPTDPFAPKAPPSADPFAPATGPKPANSFAPLLPPVADPSATKTPSAADPFAPGAPPKPADPFAPLLPPAADPFAPKAPPAADPFASAAPPKPADPFAPLVPQTVDAFAPLLPPASDPFAPAASKGQAVPTAVPATYPPVDPFAPMAPADPFAAAPAVADPFASTSSSGQAARSLESLKSAIMRHFWSWKGPNSETLVVFQPDGTLLTREKRKSRWEVVDGATVKVTHPNQTSVQIVFDDTITGFVEKGASAAIKGQRGKPLPATPLAGAAQGKMQARNTLVVEPDKIALPANWMPHNIHSRKVQLQALGMYSQKVLSQDDATPSTIWGPVTWLLPLNKAVAMLERGSYKLRSERADRLSWPIGISIHFYNLPRGKAIPDAGGLFDEIHFITDAAERVISVQLSNKRGLSSWEGGPDGTMNPYYNFLYDRANAAGGRPVQYQVRPASSGVSRVKIQCGTEVNHWYLTAPLAEMFLEISQKIGDP